MITTKTAAVIASKQNPLTSLKNEMENRGIAVKMYFREDIKGYEAADAAAQELFDGVGKLDYLVIEALEDKNYTGKGIEELSEEEYASWKYYAFGWFYDINRTFIKRMAETGGGVVFGICSESGVVPAIHQAMNGAAGASLYMGLKCLAEESLEDGIFTNTLAIGSTEDNNSIHPMTLDAQIVKHIPAGNILTEDKIMKKAVDLMMLTDDTFTGNVFCADAAFSCAYMREW